MIKILQACQNAKLLEKEQDERSKAVSKPPLLQQTLSAYNFLPSKLILSIDMWITKIGMKNMPIYYIESEVECEMVCFPKVKSVKTVLDTSHHLVAIVEDKIATMMKTAPWGQIIFDGYTVGGQHYMAVFALFMQKCTSMTKGTEYKYDKHELRLLACAPLPPVIVNTNVPGYEEEESTKFNADAHVNFSTRSSSCMGLSLIPGFSVNVQIALL
jgi:hypothetical protein